MRLRFTIISAVTTSGSGEKPINTNLPSGLIIIIKN
jgi:hypothetical protein